MILRGRYSISSGIDCHHRNSLVFPDSWTGRRIIRLPKALPDIQPTGLNYSTPWTRIPAAPLLPGHSNGGHSAGHNQKRITTLQVQPATHHLNNHTPTLEFSLSQTFQIWPGEGVEQPSLGSDDLHYWMGCCQTEKSIWFLEKMRQKPQLFKSVGAFTWDFVRSWRGDPLRSSHRTYFLDRPPRWKSLCRVPLGSPTIPTQLSERRKCNFKSLVLSSNACARALFAIPSSLVSVASPGGGGVTPASWVISVVTSWENAPTSGHVNDAVQTIKTQNSWLIVQPSAC